MFENNLFNFKASSLMLRTNPKLTTNIKLVINKDGNMFLESLDASPELSQFKFKKYKLDPSSRYCDDVYDFYDKGKFSKSFAYKVFSKNSNLEVLSNKNDQYEDFYNYGAYRLKSNLYDESNAIFAPIWLNEYLPKYFIIFKSANLEFKDLKKDILSSCSVVKTFDLTESSSIGKYLRNHLKEIPLAPIEFNSNQNANTYFNGIDYVNGGFVKKSKFIFDEYLNTDKTVIEKDYYLTTQFEELGVISANLINLEFLFDDDSSDEFEINRYFGLFVDDYSEGTFKLDIDLLYNNKFVNRFQTIYPESKALLKDNFNISSNDIISIFHTESDSFYNYSDIKDLNSILYIKDPLNNFTTMSTASEWATNEIKLNAKYLNLNTLNLISNPIYVQETPISTYGKSTMVFRILSKLPSNIGLQFYDTSEILTVYSDLSLTVNNQNNYDFYFSASESVKDISESIVKAINAQNTYLKSFTIDDKIVVYSTFEGSGFNNILLNILDQGTNCSKYIEILNSSNYFVGGSDVTSYRFLVNVDNIGAFANKLVLLDNGAYEVPDISFYIDDLKLFNNYRVVTLLNKPYIRDKSILIVEQPSNEFGKFLIYPVKDFDFNFYPTEYAPDKELALEKAYYAMSPTGSTEILDLFNTNSLYELDNNISNEYDYYHENYNVNFSNKSRTTPYISKWVYLNGTNIKDFDLRLNSAKVFGTYYRTPSSISENQNLKEYTHEWYYLANLPSYYEDSLESVFNYLPNPIISSDFYDVYEDKFINAFKYKHLFGQVIKDTDKFTIFQNASSSNSAETVFKGIKVKIFEKLDNSKINYNIDAIQLKDNYTKFNDYKFSVVLLNDSSIQSTNEIEIIKNEKFKFIVILVKLNIDIPIEKTLLYSATHNYADIDVYADSRLNGSIDLEKIIFANNQYTIEGIVDTRNAMPDFTRQIKIDKNGKFFNVYFKFNGELYKISEIFRVLSKNKLIARKFQKIDGPNIITNLVSFPMVYPTKKDMQSINYIDEDSGIFVESSGYNFYKNIMSNISFGFIYKSISKGNPDIKYTTILENGDVVKDEFLIKLIPPEQVIMPMYLKDTPITDKPINFNFVDVIGYSLTFSDVSAAPFYIHNGLYTPKMTNVFEFNSIDDVPNLEILNVQPLKNVYYHKVSNKNYPILELKDSPVFESNYPLIHESGFDYKDINVFKTNWQDDYYFNYLSKNISENILFKGGTELKTYLGSKLMKTPFNILLQNGIKYSYSLNNSSLELTLDFTESLLNYFMANIKAFNNNLDYITSNIIKLYIIDELLVYTKKINGSGIDLSFMNTLDSFKQNNYLDLDKNFTLTRGGDLIVTIKLNLLNNFKYLIGISSKIKLI